MIVWTQQVVGNSAHLNLAIPIS